MVAVLAVAGACGELDPAKAPVDAKKDDFCGAWVRLVDAEPSATGDDLEDYLNELARYGAARAAARTGPLPRPSGRCRAGRRRARTPRGIPTAARNGYEYLIDPDRSFGTAGQVLAVATQTDAAGQDAAALKLYATQTCD